MPLSSPAGSKRWLARRWVLVKLTPNITDIRAAGRAARRGNADGVSAINTINSITGIDLDTCTPRPDVGGRSAHGGYWRTSSESRSPYT